MIGRRSYRSNDFDTSFRKMQRNGQIMNKVVLGFVAVACVLFIGVLFLNLGMSATGQIQARATQEAQTWTREMYPNETSHVACQNSDTDSNGYVSCTVRVGERAPMGIECAVPLSMNNGCRIPPLQNMLQRQNQ